MEVYRILSESGKRNYKNKNDIGNNDIFSESDIKNFKNETRVLKDVVFLTTKDYINEWASMVDIKQLSGSIYLATIIIDPDNIIVNRMTSVRAGCDAREILVSHEDIKVKKVEKMDFKNMFL